MEKNILQGKKHIHFIGIGGSGMYPLAQILHANGYHLTGSDNNETETLDAVRKMGIKVFMGQKAENIEGADLIVYSAAIMADHEELVAAKQSGADVLERSELLGYVTSCFENAVCVSGTHGKTTTTSMITQIFMTANVDISAVIGGKLPCINGSGRAGNSDIMICEACEFVDTFLKLYPDIAVVLNVDADHLDYFGTLENIKKSFVKFCNMATKAVVYNGDDANTLDVVNEIKNRDMVSFGLNESNDYYAKNIRKIGALQTVFDVYEKGEKLSEITLNVAGKHNVLNALAAIASARYLNCDIESIAKGIEEFRGAKRRFELIGIKNGITVVDDYAHHPAELEVTLNAAMEMGYKNVWAVFQPFTFSRTHLLLDDFAKALSIADKVVLTDIMGSREKNTYNIYTHDLGRKIENAIWFEDNDGHIPSDAEKTANFEKVCKHLADNVQYGDLVITLGCGDCYKAAKMLLEMI